jgi:hypothetical protein
MVLVIIIQEGGVEGRQDEEIFEDLPSSTVMRAAWLVKGCKVIRLQLQCLKYESRVSQTF